MGDVSTHSAHPGQDCPDRVVVITLSALPGIPATSTRIHQVLPGDDMDNKLDTISLCTYSNGKVMVREVLEDWLQFLGGRPKQVIFAISPASGRRQFTKNYTGKGRSIKSLGLTPRIGRVEKLTRKLCALSSTRPQRNGFYS